MLQEMRTKAAGDRAPHNRLYRPEKDGVATTIAGFVAAALEIRDPYQASRSEREQIRKGHLLLAAANAMQPGVFSLSSWDLVRPADTLGVRGRSSRRRRLPLDQSWRRRSDGGQSERERVVQRLERAECCTDHCRNSCRMPRSFVSQLQRLLQARKKHRIAEGELLAVPEVEHAPVCILVMQVPGRHARLSPR